MKDLIDIHVVLSTADDMQDYHDDPQAASDNLNDILFLLFDHIDNDWEVEDIEKCLQYCWQVWVHDSHLGELDPEDFQQIVDHLLATWEDALNEDELN
jgi:hypothetical protein